MTLIVHRGDHNPIRSSRFFKEIKARGLKKLGVVYTDDRPKDPDDPEDNGCWLCHKCDANNPRSDLVFDEGHKDILLECPSCSYPFLVVKP